MRKLMNLMKLLTKENSLILNLDHLMNGKMLSHGHINLKTAKVLNVWQWVLVGAVL